jgi:hypothetical protein
VEYEQGKKTPPSGVVDKNRTEFRNSVSPNVAREVRNLSPPSK